MPAISIVAYALGITRVDPIRHDLLFERFINEGRVAYPDIDIDFASSRREEVIQYVYQTYGVEHTGMVANLVTYRARSAVREVGTALGFPGPLVDRVAKALETYDSVMVRRDLEADGGFAELFRQPGGTPGQASTEAAAATARAARASWTAWASSTTAGTRPMRAPTPRPGRCTGRSDDEGGPGDTPVSEAWIRRESAPGRADRPLSPLHPVDAESGMLLSEPRAIDGTRPGQVAGRTEAQVDRLGRPDAHKLPRDDAEREPRPMPQGGSIADLSPWERWLELCARLDGFPRHLSIHVGGMLVTREPLVSIAPLERATMPGRVVIQWDKRDVESLGLVKLDLLGLRMLSSIDEAVRLVLADCGVRLDLDALPEDLPEVYEMIMAADTVGVFQVESRAQMQALPKARPDKLDDLIVQVAIIRPGPIQGNAVHPYLRRRQGIEPVSYLHPSLGPILRETLGVILYQEQVMKIAIDVAGFSAADSDGFRRAMGTWRSSKEMEKLHARFVDGCVGQERPVHRAGGGAVSPGCRVRLVRVQQEPCGRVRADRVRVGVPEAVLPGPVRDRAHQRPADGLLSRGGARQRRASARLRGAARWTSTAAAGGRPRNGSGCPGSRCRMAAASTRRPVVGPVAVVRRPRGAAARQRGRRRPTRTASGWAWAWSRASARRSPSGWMRSWIGVRIGRWRMSWPGPGCRRRSSNGSSGRAGSIRWVGHAGSCCGSCARSPDRPDRASVAARHATRSRGDHWACGCRPHAAPDLPPPTELERLGDSYAILSLDARHQVTELFRPALDRLGAVTNAALSEHRPGRVRIGGLVVTRQHPMTARGTVFLAMEDETGMANVTLWPSVWAELRGVVRRHALLLVDGDLQREGRW